MFGFGLRYYRRLSGLTQGDIADACAISRSAVAQWEKSGHVPEDKWPIIAEKLDVTVDAIIKAGETREDKSRSVLGFALRELRTKHGKTQMEVAEAANVNASTVRYWERSGNLPEEHLDAVSATLGITIRELRAKAAQLLASQPVEDEELIATWRDAIMLDNNLEGLVKLLLATWGYFWVDAIKAVSVTPEKLKQKAGWSDEHIQATWAKALATPYVEPIDEEGTLLRLKFPT